MPRAGFEPATSEQPQTHWDRQELQLQSLPRVVRQRNIINSWVVLYCPQKEWRKDAGRPECEGTVFRPNVGKLKNLATRLMFQTF